MKSSQLLILVANINIVGAIIATNNADSIFLGIMSFVLMVAAVLAVFKGDNA